MEKSKLSTILSYDILYPKRFSHAKCYRLTVVKFYSMKSAFNLLGFGVIRKLKFPREFSWFNRLGFCKEHLGGMMKKRGRLPLALILESHAKELCDNIFSSSYQKNGLKAKQVHSTCFVCEKIEWGFERMINTIYLTYERDKEFRDLFDSQEFFCLEHYSLLAANSSKKVMRKYYSEFNKALEETVSKYLENLHSDLEKYCSMYDYRNNTENADWGTSKDSVERAALFLTGISE